MFSAIQPENGRRQCSISLPGDMNAEDFRGRWAAMAYELVKEVRDHAPAGLDPTARLILVWIAEECRGGSRMRDIPTETLCRRTGLDGRGLRHALERLAAAGINVRVALAHDKHNRPLYALTGRVCRWVLPPLEPPAGCSCDSCSHGADPQVLPQTAEDVEVRPPDAEVRAADLQGHAAGPTGPPIPSIEFPFGGDVVVDRATALEHIRAATAAASRRTRNAA